MRKRLATMLALVLVCAAASVARADPTADAKAVGDAFAKAMAAGDVPAVLALYRDDASIVWPGHGEEAQGKEAIERVVRAAIGSAPKDMRLVQKSNQARALGDDYLVNVGRWENSFTTASGRHVIMDVRTTEVLEKTGGKWLYLVDHASVGLPRAAERARARRERR
jgi:uncharacterized protein (TIGR02246 family)